MKNLFVILAVAGIFALVSCGGSKKDDDQSKQDSIRKLDSIAKAKEDSIAEAEGNTTGGGYYVPTNTGGNNTTTNTGDNNTVTNPVRGGAVKNN